MAHLGLLSFDLWEEFAVVIGLVTPMVVWIFVPELLGPVVVVVLALVMTRRGRRHRRQMRLLASGVVAQVVDGDDAVRDSTPTSTSYENVPMRHARGWSTNTQLYSGSGRRSTVDFTVDGAEGPVSGSVTVRGLIYDGGVVLADPGDVTTARVVSQFPFDIRPDAQGQLVVSPSILQVVGVAFTVVLYGGGLVVALVASAATF